MAKKTYVIQEGTFYVDGPGMEAYARALEAWNAAGKKTNKPERPADARRVLRVGDLIEMEENTARQYLRQGLLTLPGHASAAPRTDARVPSPQGAR